MKLVIGNQNYSTWSMRPWLLLKAFNVSFESQQVSLAAEGLRERLLEHSPTARVPVLLDNNQAIWDSLAICEYVNEVYLDNKAWPVNALERAKARALTCEIHAGFFAVRGAMPMNIRAQRQIEISVEMKKEIHRIEAIWADHASDGWLFENFSIADCFYAPVALRFKTYGIELNSAASQYMTKLLAHPAVIEWVEQALLEDEVLPQDEAGVEV